MGIHTLSEITLKVSEFHWVRNADMKRVDLCVECNTLNQIEGFALKCLYECICDSLS